jgi:WD40 repeat protein
MHLLKVILNGFLSGGWFPFFGDLASTASQHSQSSILDAQVHKSNYTGTVDGQYNWLGGVLLPNQNKVYIIPSIRVGTSSPGFGRNHSNRGLLYDIATDTYSYSAATYTATSSTGSYVLTNGSGILLDDGRVFIAPGDGGTTDGVNACPVHIYNPVNDTLQTIARPAAQNFSLAGKLKDGKVIMFSSTSSSYIFDPQTNTFSGAATPPFIAFSGYFSCVLLPNGKLLISPQRTVAGSTSYYYDQDTNSYTTNTLPANSGFCLLSDGNIFYVRAGSIGDFYNTNGYIWNTTTGGITTIPNVIPTLRWAYAMGLLPDGRVLFSNSRGVDGEGKTLRMFNPFTNSVTAVTTITGELTGPDPETPGFPVIYANQVLLLPTGKALLVNAYRISGTTASKFSLVQGQWCNLAQFPSRQYNGSYLDTETNNYPIV